MTRTHSPSPFLLALLCCGVLLHALDVYNTITVLPSAVREIGGTHYYAWNTTLFVIFSVIGSSLAPRLVFHYGERCGYLAACGLFAGGSLLCALAWDMPWLVAGRSVQGFGGGLLMAGAYIIISRCYDGPRLTRAIGVTGTMWGIATLTGPAVGGFITELAGWRWAFAVLIPAAGLVAWGSAAWLSGPLRRPEQPPPLPWASMALISLVLAAVTISGTATGPWQRGICLAIVAGCAGYFVLWRRSLVGTRPPGTLWLYLLLGVLGASICYVEIYLALFLQQFYRLSPVESGYMVIIAAAGWSLCSWLSPRWPQLAKPSLLGAPLAIAASFALLAWTLPPGAQPAAGSLWVAAGALLICGCAVGICWPHLFALLIEASPVSERGNASAGCSTIQMFASGLAAAVAGLVFNLLAAGREVADLAPAVISGFYGYGLIIPLLGVVAGMRYLWRHAATAGRASSLPRP